MAQASTPQPSWFTPKRLLAIFCIINLLNYVDRGAIASNGVNGKRSECTKSGTCSSASGIQGDFNLSNFQDGVISSAFMVGLLLASPIFASLAKSVNPFRLIGVGLTVWTFATAGCGLSIDFWSITICRMLVGVGEASFISLAAPFIDDNAPVDQKTAWLGIFYMCIPTGIAVGYVYGGLVGSLLNWRWAFWIEALLMLPFAILGFVVKPLQLKGFSHTGPKRPLTSVQTSCPEAVASPSQDGSFQTRNVSKDDSKGAPRILNQLTRFWKDMKVLLLEKVYVVNVLGYIAYNFVIGAYSYWGPKAGYYIYHMNNADLMFGGITIVCGIVGTLAGGFVLDLMTSTISNAFKGPVNYVCLHSVKPSLRPLSMAMSTVSIHIFGDVPSSPLVGVLQVSFFIVLIDLMKKMSIKLMLLTVQTQFHYLRRNLQLKVFAKSWFVVFSCSSFIISFWDLQICYVISLILSLCLHSFRIAKGKNTYT
ncbi:probable sphingolipid transporter spinster homolog 2 isoform X3 [Lycium barbarum]|uniref:probable sphingolipid transporter spinster homolog 2 isoform X3 n=1 Tax=Lycium barbarum TaxID=112863 RepID=UPI00293E81DC|nr:probable sphingolipid transporter spinster homolog 2 isoform X3 [Lycium barbarum]